MLSTRRAWQCRTGMWMVVGGHILGPRKAVACMQFVQLLLWPLRCLPLCWQPSVHRLRRITCAAWCACQQWGQAGHPGCPPDRPD